MPNCKGGRRGVEENAAGGKLSRFLKMGEGCFIHHQPFMWHSSSQDTEMVWCKYVFNNCVGRKFFFFFFEAGTLVEVLSFWSSQDFKVLREYFTNLIYTVRGTMD